MGKEMKERNVHTEERAGVRYSQNHSPGAGEHQITHHGEENRGLPKGGVSE